MNNDTGKDARSTAGAGTVLQVRMARHYNYAASWNPAGPIHGGLAMNPCPQMPRCDRARRNLASATRLADINSAIFAERAGSVAGNALI